MSSAFSKEATQQCRLSCDKQAAIVTRGYPVIQECKRLSALRWSQRGTSVRLIAVPI